MNKGIATSFLSCSYFTFFMWVGGTNSRYSKIQLLENYLFLLGFNHVMSLFFHYKNMWCSRVRNISDIICVDYSILNNVIKLRFFIILKSFQCSTIENTNPDMYNTYHYHMLYVLIIDYQEIWVPVITYL